ncbi:MAG: phosphatidate cytidylyltransferase [Bacteroidales bacterium]|nr:phosphatidate cytidylyltransferase [Bacteroidales bacterium]MDD3989157.1 phosphatidate cytidylyltransferase [Bacteroidales bacterium]MDD4639315.1 phosphatidate cytidylyltransferase [Bacteroidales bacterium]
MIYTIYYIILGYFLAGTIGIFLVNRKRDRPFAKRNWIKLANYFIIINLLFFSIVLEKPFFYIAIIIVLTGLSELIKLHKNSVSGRKLFFTISLIIYLVLSSGFLLYSGMKRESVLYVFLLLSIFDSFSQISGQLFGKRKLMPGISPNKTWEGLAGGVIITFLSGILVKGLVEVSVLRSIVISAGIIIAAFAGDAASSYYKRRYEVKDFSNLIPGHGGVLDRFDSLISAGAVMAFADIILGIKLLPV